MTERIDPHKAIDFIIKTAPKFAQAKANRVYIESFSKSLKAKLMQESPESSAAAQERDAYAHEDYIANTEGLRAAVEEEETLRWQLVAAQARVEVWRSLESSARAEGKATQ